MGGLAESLFVWHFFYGFIIIQSNVIWSNINDIHLSLNVRSKKSVQLETIAITNGKVNQLMDLELETQQKGNKRM